MVACIQKQHYSEDMKIKDGQQMQVKLIMQKEACSEFVWPINLCNLLDEQEA